MIPLQLMLLRHAMFPHVIGDLVAACAGGTQRPVQLADAAGREDRRLDAVAVEQLDQPPDADPAAELALRSCIGGSFNSRRSSMASKSAVKLTAMRMPFGHLMPSITLCCAP